MGVPAEAGSGLHEARQFVLGKESRHGQRGIQRRRTVAFAEDEAVAKRVARAAGIDAQHAGIEGGEDVRRGEIASWMTGPGTMHHAKAVAPHGVRDFAQSADPRVAGCGLERKSTRLNSSHLVISYAVF